MQSDVYLYIVMKLVNHTILISFRFFCYSWDDDVRTYMDHVKNIYHLELANPLTKRILLVIG